MIVEETKNLPVDQPTNLEDFTTSEVLPEQVGEYDAQSAFESILENTDVQKELGIKEEEEEEVVLPEEEEEAVPEEEALPEEEEEEYVEEEEESPENEEANKAEIEERVSEITLKHEEALIEINEMKDKFVEESNFYAQNLALATTETVKELNNYNDVDWSQVSLSDQQIHKERIVDLQNTYKEQELMLGQLQTIAESHAQEQRLQAAKESFPILQEKIEGWSKTVDSDIRKHAIEMGVPEAVAMNIVDAPTLIAFYNSMRLTNGKEAAVNTKSNNGVLDNVKTQKNNGRALVGKKKKVPNNDFNKKGAYSSDDARSAFERML